MGGGLILIIIAILVGASFLVQELGFTRNSLLARQETYILLFAIFSMGILGFIDDLLNIKGKK